MLLFIVGAGTSAYFSHANPQLLVLQQQVQESISHVKNSVAATSHVRSTSSSLDALVAYLATLLGWFALLVAILPTSTSRYFGYIYTTVQRTPQKEKELRWWRDDIL
jgi:hypothetical protein